MNFHRGFDTFEYVRGHSADPWAFPLSADPDLDEGRVSAAEVRRHRRRCYRKFFNTLRPKGKYFAGVTLGKAGRWLLDHQNVKRLFCGRTRLIRMSRGSRRRNIKTCTRGRNC